MEKVKERDSKNASGCQQYRRSGGKVEWVKHRGCLRLVKLFYIKL
jgi:hypothetical protein